MPQQDQSPEQKSRDQKTVRGEDLRSKMIDSHEKGEDYRSTHQGADERSPDHDHEKGRARTYDKDQPAHRNMKESPERTPGR